MKRAPKKFTDATQSEITEEWKAWWAEGAEERNEQAQDIVASMLHEQPQDRFPENYGKEVGAGAWILVVEEPSTEMRSRFRIPTPSLWWARPEDSRPCGFNAGSDARPISIPGVYRVVIETPGGSLWLFPREYVVCSDPLPLITDPECTIHSLGGTPDFDEDQVEQMFYLQSRGYSRQDAMLALMEGIDWSSWGWVEFPEYARAAFEGVGRTVRLG